MFLLLCINQLYFFIFLFISFVPFPIRVLIPLTCESSLYWILELCWNAFRKCFLQLANMLLMFFWSLEIKSGCMFVCLCVSVCFSGHSSVSMHACMWTGGVKANHLLLYDFFCYFESQSFPNQNKWSSHIVSRNF